MMGDISIGCLYDGKYIHWLFDDKIFPLAVCMMAKYIHWLFT